MFKRSILPFSVFAKMLHTSRPVYTLICLHVVFLHHVWVKLFQNFWWVAGASGVPKMTTATGDDDINAPKIRKNWKVKRILTFCLLPHIVVPDMDRILRVPVFRSSTRHPLKMSAGDFVDQCNL